MASEITSIGRAQFQLEFHSVHPGQNFVGIDRRKFTLDFNPLRIGLNYKLALATAEYKILSTTLATKGRLDWRSEIVEASYTILTSRTSPLEPQPFLVQRAKDGIPQVIV